MKLAKDQIARQFSRAATTYDLAAQLQNEMAQRLVGSIPADLTGTLVDLGCGTGWALEKIAESNRFQLIAVDLAPGMIEVAESRVPSAEFHCCDLEETPLVDHTADIVYSNAAIQWCDADAAIQEMHRLCKPNGSIVFSTFGPKTLNEIRAAWEAVGDESDRVHDFVTVQRIESTLNELKLTNVDVVSELRMLTYNSVDVLLQGLKLLGATNASVGRQSGLLGTGRYREFRNELTRQLVSDGELTLTFECVFAEARKS